MYKPCSLAAFGFAAVFCVLRPSGAFSAPAAKPVDYNFQIRPILSDRCFICHGPDEKKRKADLRLDKSDSAFGRGVIVPGHPEKSPVVERITTTGRDHMPPRKSNLSLSQEEIELIQRWVAEGAQYKPHWALL